MYAIPVTVAGVRYQVHPAEHAGAVLVYRVHSSGALIGLSAADPAARAAVAAAEAIQRRRARSAALVTLVVRYGVPWAFLALVAAATAWEVWG